MTQWKNMTNPNARQMRATELMKRYIDVGAEKQINIEAKFLHDVRRRFEEGNMDTLFDTALEEVFKLMMMDSYPRFSRSVFFQAMLQGASVEDDAFGDDLFLKFVDLCKGEAHPWTLVKQKTSVSVYEQTSVDDGSQLLKAVCDVVGTPAELGAVLIDPALIRKWDKDCLGSHEVERFSEKFCSFYVAYKGSRVGLDLLTVTQVDLVLAQIWRELPNGTLCILQRSLPQGDDVVPKKKDFVRCYMETGGWMLEKLDGPTDMVRITVIQQLEYSGKVSKRTKELAKARIVAISGLQDYLRARKRESRNL